MKHRKRRRKIRAARYLRGKNGGNTLLSEISSRVSEIHFSPWKHFKDDMYYAALRQ